MLFRTLKPFIWSYRRLSVCLPVPNPTPTSEIFPWIPSFARTSFAFMSIIALSSIVFLCASFFTSSRAAVEALIETIYLVGFFIVVRLLKLLRVFFIKEVSYSFKSVYEIVLTISTHSWQWRLPGDLSNYSASRSNLSPIYCFKIYLVSINIFSFYSSVLD